MTRFDYKVYVACSLTCASPEFREEVELFKKNLKTICEVLCFWGIGKEASAHQIYRWDIHECVHKSDLVVAICDLPSTGLGYEIATQVESRKMPCLMIAQDKSLVTDLIMDTRQPGCDFRRYRKLHEDGIQLVIDKLRRMHEVDSQQHSLFPRVTEVPADQKVA